CRDWSSDVCSSDLVYSETLAKFFAIATAADHLQKIPRQKERKPDRPQQIVEEANHVVTDKVSRKNETPVAPYFRACTKCQNLVAGMCSAGCFSKTKIPAGSSNSANSLFIRSFFVKRSPDFV